MCPDHSIRGHKKIQIHVHVYIQTVKTKVCRYLYVRSIKLSVSLY